MKEKINIVDDDYFDHDINETIKKEKRGMRKKIRTALVKLWER